MFPETHMEYLVTMTEQTFYLQFPAVHTCFKRFKNPSKVLWLCSVVFFTHTLPQSKNVGFRSVSLPFLSLSQTREAARLRGGGRRSVWHRRLERGTRFRPGDRRQP